MDGSSEANAFPSNSMSAVLNSTMGPGDTLYVVSGDYGATQMRIESDGTASQPKRIVGIDSGAGIPHFSGNGVWKRSEPESGQWRLIILDGSHWQIENLELSGVRQAISNESDDSASHIEFRDIQIHDVRHGIFLSNVDDSSFENVSVTHYTKHGFRLQTGCDNIVFQSCLADMTVGDNSWWEYSESFPFGFVSYGKSAGNTNVSYIDCISKNNRKNLQSRDYWNGDGFVVEGETTGVSFQNCISLNNEDAGFDVKADVSIENCVSFQNFRGYRIWGTGSIYNSVTGFPFRRANHVPNGVETTGGSGVWTKNGTATVDYFTFYGNKGRGAHEEGSGSITLTNSILAFSGAEGQFTVGSISLSTGTVTYRPGSGTAPDFVDADPNWDGIGPNLNSQTYGESKGYFQGTAGFQLDPAQVDGYGSQSQSGSTATVGSSGTALTLAGNIWRKYPFSYDVTSSTVLEVTVSASDVGEILAVGLDDDNDFDDTKSNFQLGGSQPNTDNFYPVTPDYSPGSGAVTYRIPVGSYFTGSRNYLTFVADDDADASANVTFSGIQVFESPNFSLAGFSDYSIQSGAGNVSLESGNTAVHLTGNLWQKFPFNYTFTPATVVEVTIDAIDAGEVLGIGFDSDNSYSNASTTFRLGGSQSPPSRFIVLSPSYTDGEGAVTYVIPVGEYISGPKAYVTFVADDDDDSSVDATFADLRIYESI